MTWKNCTRKGALAFVSVLLFAPSAHPQTKQYDLPLVATFSIVAIDPATGQLGVAVASRYFSVGSVVPWSEANVGAVATQANVNVGYGPRAMSLDDDARKTEARKAAAREKEKQDIQQLQGDLKGWNEANNEVWKDWIKINNREHPACNV